MVNLQMDCVAWAGPSPHGAIYSEAFIFAALVFPSIYSHIENFRSPGEETTKMIMLL